MATIDYLQYFPQSILNRSESSVLGKLWKMFSDELDEIEACLTQMKLVFSIDDMEGTSLDQIGKNILFSRLAGQSDVLYRLYLQVAILEKLSGGSNPEVLEILSLAISDYVNAQIIEVYPGNIIVWVQTEEERSMSDEATIIRRIKAGGINLILVATAGAPFVFDGDGDGEGFSSTGDTDLGGQFSVVY